MKLIDAHCHLANLNETQAIVTLFAEAKESGIISYLSAALRKSEIRYHLEHPRPEVLFSAGIHPNFDECDLELPDIEKLSADKQIWAIGEIGLDRNNPDLASQIDILIRQLKLAETYKLPVVLHIVGLQVQAYEILRRHPLKYLVHGYAGSIEGYKVLSRLDSVFTISERIMKPDKLDLLSAIVADEAYLFETDITQYYTKAEEHNPLLRLHDVFNRTSELCKAAPDNLEQVQLAAFEHITGKKL